MLEKIKKVLFETYGPDEEKGLFLSSYTAEHELMISQWVIASDAPLHELVEDIYEQLEEKMADTVYVACDIVSEIIHVEDTKEILSKDPQEFGFVLIWESEDGESSGVMLPWVAWVADAKHALYHIKKKYDIHGQVQVYVFRTERIVVSK